MPKLIIPLFLIAMLLSLNCETISSEEASNDSIEIKENIYLFGNCIGIPPGYLLMARKDNEYCALRIVEIWRPQELNKSYSIIETYYQGDSSGDYSRTNVQYQIEKIRPPLPGGCIPVGYHYWDFDPIQCGSFYLYWTPKTLIYFPEKKELLGKIELAPTMWRHISEINLSDPRLKWYRYDDTSPHSIIPIKEYWKEVKK